MRSRHSTRTCYQISLRLRFDATETRACGRERRRYHVKVLIAWPKASSLVGLFPACIVTRTASIKACARHRRRGDRVTDRAFISRDSSTLPMLRFGVALKSRSKGALLVMNDRFVMFARCPLRPPTATELLHLQQP